MTGIEQKARPRILIVEDEAIIAEEIRDRLGRLGYDTAVADCADEAMRIAERDHPDLVLMDIRLKGPTDGIEAARRIRQRLRIPVVYLTAHSDQTTVERAKETAPFGYVLKPFQERELLIAVEMAIYMHSLERRAEQRTVELERTVEQLQRALQEIRTLRGLVPICACCKKIRNDAGYWEQLEAYLGAHTEAELSHGLCPECFDAQIAGLKKASAQ